MSKSNRFKEWSFTMNTLSELLPHFDEVMARMLELDADGVFQLEKGENTGRQHYQGYVIFKRKETKSKWISKICEGLYPEESLTLEPAQNTNKLIAYCTKADTRVLGPWYFGDLTESEKNYPDLNVKLYQWQQHLWEILKVPYSLKNERMVIVLIDGPGGKGKSKLVKYLMFKDKLRNFCKMPRDSIKSSISSAVSMYKTNKRIQGWFVDVPRKNNEFETGLANTCQIIEELKTGVLVDTMYGRGETVGFTPPHIVVFCNEYKPDDFKKYLSEDRLIFLVVQNKNLCARTPTDASRLEYYYEIELNSKNNLDNKTI